MRTFDFDRDVCDCDDYGHVTVKGPTGKKYKGHTIDDSGVIWGPDDTYMGKSASMKHAKHLIDAWTA